MSAKTWMLAAAVACAGAGLCLAEATLVNEKVLWPADSKDKPLPNIGSVRLSPDGKHVLFMRIEKPAGEEAGPRRYRLVLRELEGGKETVLPLAAATFDDPLIMLIGRDVFDAEGKRLALFVPQDANDDGVWDHRNEKLKLGFYDIASAKLTTTDLSAPIVLPVFLGKGVLTVLWERDAQSGSLQHMSDPFQPARKLSIAGLPLAVHPTRPVAVILVPDFPKPKEGQEAPGRPAMTMKVLDVQADKVLTELPVHPENSVLDDNPPRLTGEGKFLYYLDFEMQGQQRKEFLRVWDLEAGKEVARLDKGMPIGPGPGGTMVVARGGRREADLALHDPAANTWTPIAGAKAVYGLWADGGKLIYARRNAEDRQVSIHLVEIKP